MYECYCYEGYYLHSNGYNCIGGFSRINITFIFLSIGILEPHWLLSLDSGDILKVSDHHLLLELEIKFYQMISITFNPHPGTRRIFCEMKSDAESWHVTLKDWNIFNNIILSVTFFNFSFQLVQLNELRGVRWLGWKHLNTNWGWYWASRGEWGWETVWWSAGETGTPLLPCSLHCSCCRPSWSTQHCRTAAACRYPGLLCSQWHRGECSRWRTCVQQLVTRHWCCGRTSAAVGGGRGWASPGSAWHWVSAWQYLPCQHVLWSPVWAGRVQDTGHWSQEVSVSSGLEWRPVWGHGHDLRSAQALRLQSHDPAHPAERLQWPPPQPGLQAWVVERSDPDHGSDWRHDWRLPRSHPQWWICWAQVRTQSTQLSKVT